MGVEYIDANLRKQAKNTENGTHTSHQPSFLKRALASRLVVLSAGSFGSPAILERSGIGRGDVLRDNHIDQLVDLPGVGEHYMGIYSFFSAIYVMFADWHDADHNLAFSQYRASDEAETIDEVFYGNDEELAGA